jgi:hypothetical protein
VRLRKTFYLFSEDYTMSDLQKDVLIGLIFIIGIFGFISGEYVVSTVLFASAAISSNIRLNRKLHSEQLN